MEEDVDSEREAKEEISELQIADAPENFPTLFGGNRHGLRHESPPIVFLLPYRLPENFTSWVGVGNRVRRALGRGNSLPARRFGSPEETTLSVACPFAHS